MEQATSLSADPQRAARYIAEFSSRHPAIWNQLAADPERSEWIAAIFGYSHFLSEELLRHPEWLPTRAGIYRLLAAADYRGCLQEFLTARGPHPATALDFALFRRKELIRIVIRDVLGYATLPEVTSELSNLADAIFWGALASVSAHLETRYGIPVTQNTSGSNEPASFTVIALGKLGGRELNYSSDIDLMFLYSGNGETSGPHKITNKEFFKKVASQLTGILSTYTAAGLCYRVDLRLRPEGTLGDLCLPLAAAKEYYAKRARDWELQMLIKARVTAGDEALGQALLDFVEPSIYSSSLDFSAIETMSAARERISEKQARRRLTKDELNVKLARGGIRDIEFLVQCLQRLHGGRETWVRHGGTLLALARLRDKDLLWSTEYSRLADAYCFLRTLEHRLQFEDDRQTHALPILPADVERIARRMPPEVPGATGGIGSAAQLLQILNKHLENVGGIYETIVHAQRPLSYGPGPAVREAEASAMPAPKLTATGLPEDLLRSIDGNGPRLAQWLRSRGIHRSERALTDFLGKLRQDESSLRSLNDHPALAGSTLRLFELSPYLAGQLARSPELLEELRRAIDHPEKRWAFEGLAAPSNDIDSLRRFFRREMFRIQTGSICMPEPVFQTLDRTSALAEFVIARAYRIAREQCVADARSRTAANSTWQEPQGEMMVVALGRLGMREFDLGSDADLLFIIPDGESERQQFWTRVAEHLIDTLTAYGSEGPILSLDTRLRPNGREGMLVQTESKYVEYFSTKAEAWEGIAYMKARGVAGDTERATKFLASLQQVDWRRYGQGGRSKQDLRQMRMRLQREQGTATPLKAGEGGYYDADFILMYLRLKGAGMFFKSLNTPERIDVVEKMGHLERQDAEFLQEATTFFRALDHSLRLVTGRAEEKLPSAGEERQMIVELVRLWAGERAGAAALEREISELRGKMRHLFETIFAH